MPELYSDFCSLGVQGLASLEQEGHTIPAGVVNEACHSSKCGTQTAWHHTYLCEGKTEGAAAAAAAAAA